MYKFYALVVCTSYVLVVFIIYMYQLYALVVCTSCVYYLCVLIVCT